MQKYMAFMLGNHLTFIDSFQFMSSSLDKLVSNLPKDDLIYTSKAFSGNLGKGPEYTALKSAAF